MTTMLRQPAKRGRGTSAALKQFADRLKTVPGQWCDYPFAFTTKSKANTVARNIRAGRVAAFPIGQFEVQVTDGQLVIRHIG